jgi:hypothetical protein
MKSRLAAGFLLVAAALSAAELPEVGLDSGKWVCTDGAGIAEGIVTLQGDPKGYPRATLKLAGEELAGKSFRFSAMVLTKDIVPGQQIAYASPKLKVIDETGKKVLSVNNFGALEGGEWTLIGVDVTIPKDHAGPIVFEIGVQLCSGSLQAKDVRIVEAEPWRWRVLDAGHKSYFDK